MLYDVESLQHLEGAIIKISVQGRSKGHVKRLRFVMDFVVILLFSSE